MLPVLVHRNRGILNSLINRCQGERRSPMFDFGKGDAVPLVKKVGGRRSPAFPLENITGALVCGGLK
jgi:hypothetical protein